LEQLQKELVYIELPEEGRELVKGDPFGLVEAVKAASDVYAPVSGKVIAVNTATVDDPLLVVRDPWGEGWLIQIELSNPEELDTLLSNEEYDKFCIEHDGH
jgi:glycine cleavage system H protein